MERAIDQILGLLCLVSFVPCLYGLHRLGLWLEKRGLIAYWHKKPSGGTAYNPFQEIYQPQIRHVIQVREQRLGDDHDDEGSSPPPRSGESKPNDSPA